MTRLTTKRLTEDALPPKPASAREENQKRRLWLAWGDYLQAYLWDHYVTLTFRFHVTAPHAQRIFLDQWVRRVAHAAQGPVPTFYAIESNAGGETYHVHALAARTAHVASSALEGAWNHGNTRVLRYNPDLGAAFYIVKALHRAPDYYDISKRRPPLLAGVAA